MYLSAIIGQTRTHMNQVVGSRNCELSGVKPVKVNGQMSFIVLFQKMIERRCENKKSRNDSIFIRHKVKKGGPSSSSSFR